MKGGVRVTHDAVVSGSEVVVGCSGFNALLVHHVIVGATTGGFVSLTMSGKDNGVFVAHHGEGTNIKTTATKDSYTSVFKGIMDWVKVVLNVTDGTHTVTVQPINI